MPISPHRVGYADLLPTGVIFNRPGLDLTDIDLLCQPPGQIPLGTARRVGDARDRGVPPFPESL